MNGKVIMSLEDYDLLKEELSARKEQINRTTEQLNAYKAMEIFELEPVLDGVSVVLSTQGKSMLEDFIQKHPEYQFGERFLFSWYHAGKKKYEEGSECMRTDTAQVIKNRS